MVIPLLINGVTGNFTCKKPTRSEYEDDDLLIIAFCTKALNWYQSDRNYA